MNNQYGKCTICGEVASHKNNKYCGVCWGTNRKLLLGKNREGFCICSTCKEEKPFTAEYFHRNKKTKSGLNQVCKPCRLAYNREYYKARKEENNGVPPYSHKNREYHLRFSYGLKPEDVPTNCQVCDSDKKICVDHDHETGRVRGFICDSCNVAIGKAQDDPNLLRALADYLEKS
jgi:hypothetical protein